MISTTTPFRPVRTVIVDSGDPGFINRLFLGTPTKGLVRIEWYAGMRLLMTPANSSTVAMTQGMTNYFPVQVAVPDAQTSSSRQPSRRTVSGCY